MKDEYKYKYIDPDYKYTDRTTGVLKNLLGIRDKKTLQQIEYRETWEKAKSLRQKSPKIKDISDVLKIHKYLFGRIYEWAGELREVEISKQGNQFFPTSRFKSGIQYINGLIQEYRQTNRNDKPRMARALAQVLDNLNFFHPFREGNGRTQRLAMYLLAREKNYMLELNPPDNPKVYEQYTQGTIDGDVGLLTNLIYDCLKPIPEKSRVRQ